MSTKHKSGDAEQSKAFIEAARELGCDESEEAFAEIVRKVAKAPLREKVSGSRNPGKGLKGVSHS